MLNVGTTLLMRLGMFFNTPVQRRRKLLGADSLQRNHGPVRHKRYTTMKKSKKGSEKNGKKKRIPAHVRAGIEEELVRLRKLVELEAIRQDVETEIIRLQGFC